MRIINFGIWFFATIVIATYITELLTLASTFGNICGIFVLIIWIVLTDRTKFFTEINVNKNKNEKSN